MRVLVAIAVVCVSTLAQEPKPCESPKQFQGRIARFDPKDKVAVFVRLSYDADNRRVRELEEIDTTSTKDYYDVLYLHNVGLEYRLNLRTKQCNKTVLTRPFVPMHLPSDAHFRGEASMGEASNPDEHVILAFFEGKFEGNFYAASVTVPNCFPVAFDFLSKQTGLIHTTYYDITGGIHDPSVFIPPSECPP
ncbi:mammalian ependymin-related protein 1-like [Gigantopelta aegis]|uniref:mammalian ependymin-related protein 1-like n=1 Tax=Gigantopelta aegis TaxID=1735272 RepID=UPI001B88DB05|nr:mammalian ependymin-related protein 1-like [Gigantopelta aegis]